MSNNKIVVYGITRSGTTLLWESIRLGFDAPRRDEAFMLSADDRRYIDKEIDNYNFEASGEDPVVLNLHTNNLQDFSPNQLKRWVSVLEDRNFHVVEIKREDFRDLVISNYISGHTGEFSEHSLKTFVATKEGMMVWMKRISILQDKMDENTLNIPVHQKITMEQFIKDGGITIGEQDFKIDDIPIATLDHLKSPKKSDRIENWDEALKMYDELYEEFGHKMSYHKW